MPAELSAGGDVLLPDHRGKILTGPQPEVHISPYDQRPAKHIHSAGEFVSTGSPRRETDDNRHVQRQWSVDLVCGNNDFGAA
jgi:hypothetical protein